MSIADSTAFATWAAAACGARKTKKRRTGHNRRGYAMLVERLGESCSRNHATIQRWRVPTTGRCLYLVIRRVVATTVGGMFISVGPPAKTRTSNQTLNSCQTRSCGIAFTYVRRCRAVGRHRINVGAFWSSPSDAVSIGHRMQAHSSTYVTVHLPGCPRGECQTAFSSFLGVMGPTSRPSVRCPLPRSR